MSLENKCIRLENENTRLKDENHELKVKLGQTSNNSSLAPSTDLFVSPKQRSLRKKSDKSVGGQIGHKGSNLKISTSPDEIIICNVSKCENCNTDISNTYANFSNHQVVDIDLTKVTYTIYKQMKRRCPNCKRKSFGNLPIFARHHSQYGLRVLGLATYINQVHYVPVKRTAQIINELCGIKISAGTIVNNSYKISKDIQAEFVPKVKRILANSNLLHVDETGININGKNHYVHSASNSIAAYHTVYDTRGDKAVKDINILPNFSGVLVHDAYSMYFKYGTTHQLCVAHLLRELQAVTDYFKLVNPYDKSKCWAQKLTAILEKSIHEMKEGKVITNPKDKILSIVNCLKINDPPGKLGKKHLALTNRIARYINDYVRFTQNISVPATNNFAEREIRMVKVKMKVSGFCKTVLGARAFTNIRSFVSTLNKHNVSVLESISNIFTGTVWTPKMA
ncbi:hypothetical protein FACS1894125_4490 [Actinomycetota bacterium]|nr:hypothetical protein FACS1894125_4490 [Actinomycetota bacterium]